MRALEMAVESIATQIVASEERARYVKLLEEIAEYCQAVIEVWERYLENPRPAPDEVAVFMNWIGPEAAKQLYDHHLVTREKILAIVGPRSSMEDPFVELAYRKLDLDESGPQAARKAVQAMQDKLALIRGLIEKINTTVPVAPKAVKPVRAKPALKKKTAKKKIALKKAAKKTLSKKPVKKVPEKKAAPKKKIAKKHRVKSTVKKRKK